MLRRLGHSGPEHGADGHATELACADERIARLRPRPPGAELGQRQVGCERPAAVPDRSAVPASVLGQADGVAGDLAGAGRAVPVTDQHTGLGQAGEEFLLSARSGRSAADFAAQPRPGWLLPSAPERLLGLRPGRPAGGGAVGRGGGTQAEVAFRVLAGLPDAEVVVPDLRADLVLPGQGRHQVDVIGGVPDRHPAHREVIPGRGEAGPVHDGGCHLRPLGVGQQSVLGGGADRAVPYQLAVVRPVERGQGLGEQPGQAAEVA